jgi:hypothetical protein
MSIIVLIHTLTAYNKIKTEKNNYSMYICARFRLVKRIPLMKLVEIILLI